MTAQRSEQEVAADVVARLLAKGWLPKGDKARVARIARDLALPLSAIAAAADKAAASGWRVPHYSALRPTAGREAEAPRPVADVPARALEAAPAPPPAGRSRRDPMPRPEGMKPATNARRERVIDGVPHLWCTGGKDHSHEAHWAPEASFLVRADLPHRRVTMCDDHRRRYQRARHVRVKVVDDLAAVGLAFVIDGESNLVGLRCKGCGNQLMAGDKAKGDAVLWHDACHPDGPDG